MGRFFEIYDSRAYSVRPPMPTEPPADRRLVRTPEPMVYYTQAGTFAVVRTHKKDGKWSTTQQTVKTFKQALRLRNHWKRCDDRKG